MNPPDDSEATGRAPTAREAKRLRVSEDYEDSFDDLVLEVQLEHELAGFETIATTRIDQLIAGQLGEDVGRTAMVLVCHAEIARDALDIDQEAAGLFPCTTLVYESEADGQWYIYHASATKATRDLGFYPADADAVADLVELTGDRMESVWAELESRFGTASEPPA